MLFHKGIEILQLGNDYYRDHVPFSSYHIRVSMIVSTGDVNLGYLVKVTYASFHLWKMATSPFLFVRTGITKVQPTFLGRGIQKNLWTRVYVQITSTINKYLVGRHFEAMQLPCFLLQPLLINFTVIGGSCL